MSTSCKILVMEDNHQLRHLYSKSLRHLGYDVCEASTIAEARSLFIQSKFDVFLCDLHMGAESSLPMLREKMDQLSRSGTQVIVVSGENQYHEKLENDGLEFFLEKPVSMHALGTLVTRLAPGRLATKN